MPKKGRARRFREAREMKRGFDDDLFGDDKRSLADVHENKDSHDSSEPEIESHDKDWDDEDPLKQ